MVMKRNDSCPYWELKTRHPAHRLVTILIKLSQFQVTKIKHDNPHHYVNNDHHHHLFSPVPATKTDEMETVIKTCGISNTYTQWH
jgi:hypothetical protein